VDYREERFVAVAKELERTGPQLVPWQRRLEKAPWWALILILTFVFLAYQVFASETYHDTFNFLFQGVKLTLLITLTAYSIAIVLGLIVGLGRVSSNIVPYTLSTLYVEVMRGIPLLVQLIYVAFVIVPMTVNGLNSLGEYILARTTMTALVNLGMRLQELNIQDVDMATRGMIGLAVGYAAYEAEVFRAGIQSIEKGQMEAARSLGMTYFQAMRYIILPQAIRRVLPPLGNDFIAMLKDSSLLSALAVRELTQLGKLNRARTFRTFETWNMVAFLYLVMTLLLSMLVKLMERRMATE
jgi:polar amino acid transport system permease protein